MVDQNVYSYQGYQGYQKLGEELYGQNVVMYSNVVVLYVVFVQYLYFGIYMDVVVYGSSGNYYDFIGYQFVGYWYLGDGEQVQSLWSDFNQGKYNYVGYMNVGFGGVNVKVEDNMQYV